MSDNTALNLGTGGDTVRDVDNNAYTTSTAVNAKTQVIKSDFGGQTGEVLVTTATPFPTGKTGSYFVLSTLNSSSAQLAAGTTFTGAIEAIPTALQLSLNVSADQPFVVTINYYAAAAASTWIESQTIVAQKSAQSQYWGVDTSSVANGNYINVALTNIGLATTTTLVINAQFGDIPATDQAGNTPTAIYGSGDLAGVNLLEECIKGELPLTATVTNPEARDVNNAMLLSDAPANIRLVSTNVGQAFTIDTQGYNTLSITMGTMVVSLTGSNDLAGTFSAIPAMNPNGGLGVASSLAAASNYAIPCVTRYIKLVVTTVGWASYTLRTVNTSLANMAQIPLNLVLIGGTANAAQGGFLAIGSSAATNGQTIGTQITAATPVPLVIKASAGKLFFVHVGNPNTSAVFFKIFNATSATLGTTSAAMNFYIPASSSLAIPINDTGLYLSTGITVAVTGAASLTDATAITTGCELNYTFI